VRVVDFFPPKIEDFAVGRRASEFDILPDYSGGEDTDPGEEMRAYRSGKGFPEKQWEWRFALQVVDASDKLAVKERTWLVVSNEDAQLLLDMDATKWGPRPRFYRKANSLQSAKGEGYPPTGERTAMATVGRS
jgi:protection-of-telomeres protein 1